MRRAAPLLFGLACTPHTAPPSRPAAPLLEEAHWTLAVFQPEAGDAAIRATLSSFAGPGRNTHVAPPPAELRAVLLKEARSVDRDVQDATLKKLEDAPGTEFVVFLWKPEDSAALAAAYRIAAALAARPGTWTMDEDTVKLLDARAWSELAVDAAQKPPRANLHFVNQLYPEDDGSLTIETAGTARFGLRTIKVDHITRGEARPLSRLVNLLVQRWVEGQRPEADGTLELSISALLQADAKKAALDSQLPNAKGRVRVKPVVEGSGLEAVLHLAFPDATAKSESERQDQATAELSGSADSSEDIEHSPKLLEVSRKSRERLIRELKPRIQKGLPANELLLVKAPFPCGEGREWMWVEVHSWKGSTVRGPLQSAPDCATNLHAGQMVEAKESELFDYMDKTLDGSFVGNDTGVLLHPEIFEQLKDGRRRVRE